MCVFLQSKKITRRSLKKVHNVETLYNQMCMTGVTELKRKVGSVVKPLNWFLSCSDWIQEHGERGAGSSDPGEGRAAGEGCVHLSR